MPRAQTATEAVAAPVRVAFARAGTVCVPVFVLDEERA